MRISIIIPTYGVESYIYDCLQSVAKQTYCKDLECIIVDDCTPDNSVEIAKEFCSQYNGCIDFKIINRDKNGGLSAARNTGLSAATGEYVYFLDSDDEITPDCIKNLVEPLSTKHYDFVVGGLTITTSTNEEVPNVPLLLDRGELMGNGIIQSYCRGQYYMMAWNKLCKRDFLIQKNLFFTEGIIHEDNIWSFQMACRAESMYVVPDTCYIYKLRPNSITTNQKYDRRTKSLLTIANLMAEELSNCDKTKVGYANIIVQQWLYVVIKHCSERMPTSEIQDIYNKLHHIFKPYIFSTAKSLKLSILYFVRDFHYMLPHRLGLKWVLMMKKIF